MTLVSLLTVSTLRAALQIQQNERQCIVCDGDCKSVASCKVFLAADRNGKWDMIRKYNLCKLCLFRHYGECRRNVECGVDGCSIRHNPLLHRPSDKHNEKQNTEGSDQNKRNYNVHTHSAVNKQVLFKIIPITVFGSQNQFVNTFAFIDEGSSISLIDEDIVKKLNLMGRKEPLCLKWTNNIERDEQNSQRLQINMCGPNRKHCSLEVRTVTQMSLPSQTIDYSYLCQVFPYLKGLPIDSYKNAVPTVLIGLNNIFLCNPIRIKESDNGGPTAICCRLGWFVCGNINQKEHRGYFSCHICDCNSSFDASLSDQLKQFYTLETAGICNSDHLIGKEEQRAVALLEEYTRQRSDGRYETTLLWRYDDIDLPDSYQMALKRLTGLEKTIAKNKQLLDVFEKTMDEYLKKGYIAKLGDKVENEKCKKIWYLPMFPVFNKNKPNKTRIVWDAAAKAHGVSLNSILLKGPDMISSLPGVIFRFREKSVAVSGDIEQMFHRIYIREEDCDAQRFLWRSCNTERSPDIYIMKVMIFGASCAPCTSQYIKNLNASKFESKYPKAVTAIVKNHYVDDFLASTDTIEEAKQLSAEVRYIHSKGGFNIRNWCSNSVDVLRFLNTEANCEPKSLGISTNSEPEKVLGIFWVSSKDIITYKISHTIFEENNLRNRIPTKREVLKVLMSIYDPLGLVGNFLMYLKIVLQEIWRSSIGWDESIKTPQAEKWLKWVSYLPQIRELEIPRCYLQTLKNYNNGNVELHTFVDASENGYAAVAYFRITSGSKIIVSLIGSKTRVAPLKLVSIPRLELMAALIGSRFAKNVMECHTIDIKRRVFWSDSRTVLSWIRSDHRKYHQFVAFRVSEILDMSDAAEWRWISGKENVADEAKKWSSRPDFSNSNRWFTGPPFLHLPETSWPDNYNDVSSTEEELKEHNLVIEEVKDEFIKFERFSRWCRLHRAMGFVIRFVERSRKRCDDFCIELTQHELQVAEKILLQGAQKQVFKAEIECLKNNKEIPRNSSIYKLCPFLDDKGILRLNGRIGNAEVETEIKFPVILPTYHHVTKLLILHYHCIYHHGNNETIVNEIRQRYHIPRLRAICKATAKQCQMCKIKNAIPQPPQMAKLPRSRLASYVSPFTFTGVDFFGPIMITVNRHKEKRYGALFTCLSIRAVHIEVVSTLNTSSCIIAIRSFMARRGTPREFFSDNGTNFVGAERELRESLSEVDRNEFVRTFTTANTKWNFNPPSAPHMGGAWERLVRSVKTVFYKISPPRCPSEEILRSMLAEVENTINSRPLTYIPIEKGTDEALTPNHFLLGSSNGLKPLALYDDSGVTLKESWLSSQLYAQRFWRRWVTEYMPTLTCRTKWFEKVKPLEVGDLVVVVDPANPRNVWPKGKVIEVFVAADGQVRKAKVQTASGVLERPAVKLAILEVAPNME
ncbi:uncharacterized protein LOC142242837 [Haematobia irritans]|uniref:uncharacterized protein LOC142242837 n=1 Tax=Haematobia irritans TaxID=7368 RepID=UPI003F4FD5C5